MADQKQRGENMTKAFVLFGVVLCLVGCGKLGIGGQLGKSLGNWARVDLPAGCVAKQIAAEEHGGVAVLCEDGRVFN